MKERKDEGDSDDNDDDDDDDDDVVCDGDHASLLTFQKQVLEQEHTHLEGTFYVYYL